MTPPTAGSSTASGDSELDRIQAEIERAQANLVETVGELQRRLTRAHLIEQAKAAARHRLAFVGWRALVVARVTTDRARLVVTEVQNRLSQFPMAGALIGAGLTSALWHVAKARRRRTHSPPQQLN